MLRKQNLNQAVQFQISIKPSLVGIVGAGNVGAGDEVVLGLPSIIGKHGIEHQ